MSRKFRLTLIASLFAALPAAGQSSQAGNGQDLVKDKCNSCHVLEARVGDFVLANSLVNTVTQVTVPR